MFLRSLLLVAPLVLVLSPSSASATSCKMPTPDETPKYSDVIFEAVAEKVLAADGGRSTHTRLTVNKVYRGEVPQSVAALHGGMKGYPPFQLGQKYLVFASLLSLDAPSKFGPTVFVHLCHATHALPAEGLFAEGPWIGFDPVKSFGAPRAPGEKLVGAAPGNESVTPLADAAKPDTAVKTAEVEPDPPKEKETKTDEVPPTKPKSPKGPGCAVCSAGGQNQPNPLWLFAFLGLVALGRRRSRA